MVKNSKIILFGKVMCETRRNTRARGAYVYDEYFQVGQRGDRLLAMRDNGDSKPSTFFLFFFIFLLLARNHLPKYNVCISVSCAEITFWILQSFVYIDYFCKVSRNNVREKQRRLSVNRIAKEKVISIFLTMKKLVTPSTSQK